VGWDDGGTPWVEFPFPISDLLNDIMLIIGAMARGLTCGDVRAR